jgi:hypothetical protein
VAAVLPLIRRRFAAVSAAVWPSLSAAGLKMLLRFCGPAVAASEEYTNFSQTPHNPPSSRMSKKLKLNDLRSDQKLARQQRGRRFAADLPPICRRFFGGESAAVLPTTLFSAAFAPNFESRFNYAPRTYSPRTYSLIHLFTGHRGGELKITLTKNKKTRICDQPQSKSC